MRETRHQVVPFAATMITMDMMIYLSHFMISMLMQYIVPNITKFICLSLIILLIISSFLIFDSSAISPSYSRQEIIDTPKDWQPVSNLKCQFSESEIKRYGGNISDIAAVSYFSNGNILNATIMLSSPFTPSPYLQQQEYYMVIQPPNNYDVSKSLGSARGIYVNKINSTLNLKKWSNVIYERYSNITLDRILYKIDNYTGFFDRDNKSVSFSLNLSSLSSPTQYIIHFEEQSTLRVDGKVCTIADITNSFMIPPPEYIISVFPSSIELRSGQQENLELKITTTLPERSSNVSLSAQYDKRLLDLNITSPKIIVEPLGSNSSIIKIKAVNDIPSESLPSTQIPVIKATASMLRQVFFGNISSGLKSNCC